MDVYIIEYRYKFGAATAVEVEAFKTEEDAIKFWNLLIKDYKHVIKALHNVNATSIEMRMTPVKKKINDNKFNDKLEEMIRWIKKTEISYGKII